MGAQGAGVRVGMTGWEEEQGGGGRCGNHREAGGLGVGGGGVGQCMSSQCCNG